MDFLNVLLLFLSFYHFSKNNEICGFFVTYLSILKSFPNKCCFAPNVGQYQVLDHVVYQFKCHIIPFAPVLL